MPLNNFYLWQRLLYSVITNLVLCHLKKIKSGDSSILHAAQSLPDLGLLACMCWICNPSHGLVCTVHPLYLYYLRPYCLTSAPFTLAKRFVTMDYYEKPRFEIFFAFVDTSFVPGGLREIRVGEKGVPVVAIGSAWPLARS
jgi:hypothetical protein